MGIRFAEKLKVLPVLAPADSTDCGTQFVDMEEIQWLTYLVSFGTMTSDSTDTITVTVECSLATSTAATDINLPFHYRLSSAVATDSMGSITTCTSTESASITATDDDKVLIIDVDPACIPVQTSYTAHKYVRLFFDMSAQLASNIVGAIAVIEPRYPGNSMNSST